MDGAVTFLEALASVHATLPAAMKERTDIGLNYRKTLYREI